MATTANKSAQSDSVVYVWDQLPDPRKPAEECEIRAAAPAWYHIVVEEGHVENEGPWREWLGEKLLRALCRYWRRESLDDETLTEVCQTIAPDVRHCLQGPLVLLMSKAGSRSNVADSQRVYAHLPLPSGARMIVAAKKTAFWLVTCFFSTEACATHFAVWRWLAEMESAVRMYAERNRDGQLVLPCEKYSVEFSGKNKRRKEHRGAFRFVTPQNWGFQGDTPATPWEPPSEYPTPFAGEDKPPAVTLRPRRRMESDEVRE